MYTYVNVNGHRLNCNTYARWERGEAIKASVAWTSFCPCSHDNNGLRFTIEQDLSIAGYTRYVCQQFSINCSIILDFKRHQEPLDTYFLPFDMFLGHPLRSRSTDKGHNAYVTGAFTSTAFDPPLLSRSAPSPCDKEYLGLPLQPPVIRSTNGGGAAIF